MYQAYNPYFYQTAATAASKGGFLSRLLRGNISFTSILNNTQKTLNVVNQAIPIYYQVKPLVSNARTLFKIAGAIKEEDRNSTPSIKNKPKEIPVTSNQPVFFL